MKKFLCSVLLLCVTLGAVVSASAEPLELTFWNLLTGGDGETMVSMIEDFNASQSDYIVKGVSLDWDSYYTKLRTSVLGGDSPTFAISHYPYVPTLAKEGIIVPIDDYVTKLGMTIEYDKYAGMIEDMRYEDHYYAVPLEQNIVILYYNKALCEKAGLLDENGKLAEIEPTIEAFCEMMETAKASIGGGQPLVFPETPSASCKMFFSIYYQNGATGEVVNDAGEWVMDRERAIAALDTLQKVYSYNVKNVENARELFSQGEIPFLLAGNWESKPVEAVMGDNVDVVATPQLGPTFYTHALGHSFILPTNAKRTDEEVAGVITFINWFAQHNDEWSSAGSVPAYLPAAETELFKSYRLLAEYAWAGAHGLPLCYNAPFSLSGAPEIGDPIGKLARNECTPEEAFDEMTARMTTALQK